MRLKCLAFAFLFSCLAAAYADDRLPIPDEGVQREADALVKDVYGDEMAKARTAEQKSILVKTLSEQAERPNTVPASRFALYRAALDAAPDAIVAMSIIDNMAQHFQFDGLRAKASTLVKLSKSVKVPSEQKALAEASIQLMDSYVVRDDFDSAAKVGELAFAAAKKSRDTALIRSVQETSDRVAELQEQFQTVQASFATLEANPVDPKANEVAGRYRCFVKGDWQDGLPMLALCDDEELKLLATSELKQPTTSKEQVALADGWYDLADSSKAPNRDRMLQRAGYWYRAALRSEPQLTALLKAKVEKRVKELPDTLESDAVAGSSGSPPASGIELVSTLAPPDSSNRGRFHPDGTKLATGHADGSIRIWDVANGTVQETFGKHAQVVTCLDYSPDGKWIASGSKDRTIKRWSEGKLKMSVTGHGQFVRSVNFSPDGKYLLSAGWGGGIKLWNLPDLTPAKTFSGHTKGTWNAVFAPDGRSFASVGADDTVKLWSLSGQVRTFKGHTKDVRALTFSPDGSRVISGGQDTSIKIWDKTGLRSTLTGHEAYVIFAAVSPDGQLLASCDAAGRIIIWQVASGKKQVIPDAHAGLISSVDFSPDGKLLVSTSEDKTIKLWRVK